jgi:predicted Fe-Mo cluster-binding NifX family protein
MQAKRYENLRMAAKYMDNNIHAVIAVPTNDEVTIFSKMLGMADRMFIYEINNGQMKLVEKRKNPYAKTQQHLKTLDVYDLLRDCGIIVSARIGKKGIQRLEARGVKLMQKKGNIQKALQDVLEELKADY